MKHDDDRIEPPIAGLERLYADRTPPPKLEEHALESFRSAPGPARWTKRAVILRAAAAIVVFAAGWGLGAFVSGGSARAGGEGATTADGPGATRIDGPRAAPGGGPGTTRVDGPGVTTGSSPAYMLLLWEGEAFRPDADPASVAEAYAAWGRSVAEAEIGVSGEELGAERVIVGADERPSAESARIGGYFLLGVETLDEARRLAANHPHVASGGVIEIAPVVRR